MAKKLIKSKDGRVRASTGEKPKKTRRAIQNGVNMGAIASYWLTPAERETERALQRGEWF